jgi:hypothetical protein
VEEANMGHANHTNQLFAEKVLEDQVNTVLVVAPASTNEGYYVFNDEYYQQKGDYVYRVAQPISQSEAKKPSAERAKAKSASSMLPNSSFGLLFASRWLIDAVAAQEDKKDDRDTTRIESWLVNSFRSYDAFYRFSLEDVREFDFYHVTNQLEDVKSDTIVLVNNVDIQDLHTFTLGLLQAECSASSQFVYLGSPEFIAARCGIEVTKPYLKIKDVLKYSYRYRYLHQQADTELVAGGDGDENAADVTYDTERKKITVDNHDEIIDKDSGSVGTGTHTQHTHKSESHAAEQAKRNKIQKILDLMVERDFVDEYRYTLH